MPIALEILTVSAVAVAMALSLAHALELPGKMRLSKEHYLAVQPIYYPGFTWAGIAEPLGVLLLAALLFFQEGTGFWLVAFSLVALAAAHGCYWLLTHPVNNFWLRDTELGGAGSRFFGSDPTGSGKQSDAAGADWTAMRDRWERSHVVRAVLSGASFILLVAAVVP